MTQECSKCKEIKSLDCFSTEKTPSNPNWVRKVCKDCRKKQRREKNKQTGYYKKIYQNMSEEKKKEYIKKKVEQNKKRYYDSDKQEKRKQYQLSDRGIFTSYKSECNKPKRKRRNILMLLPFEEFSSLINDKCYYCGKENCRGIDRVDSDQSYTKENSVPCCKICNQMKNSMDIKSFIDHIKQIIVNTGN